MFDPVKRTLLLIIACVILAIVDANTPVSSWGNWEEWTPCSVTCGYGSITKTGYWYNGQGIKTNETYVQHSGCYLDIKCPVNGNWTMWSPYSACSKPCGPGYRTRSRECTNPRPLNGGMDCLGASTQQTSCSLQDCPPIPPNFDLSVCDQSTKLWCTSKRMCVEKNQRCDRTVQCHDGSDEYLCYKYSSNSAPTYHFSVFKSLLTILPILSLIV